MNSCSSTKACRTCRLNSSLSAAAGDGQGAEVSTDADPGRQSPPHRVPGPPAFQEGHSHSQDDAWVTLPTG